MSARRRGNGRALVAPRTGDPSSGRVPADLCSSAGVKTPPETSAPQSRMAKRSRPAYGMANLSLYLYLLTQVKAARGLWEPFVSKIVV